MNIKLKYYKRISKDTGKLDIYKIENNELFAWNKSYKRWRKSILFSSAKEALKGTKQYNCIKEITLEEAFLYFL